MITDGYTPREYQAYILDKLTELRPKNIIIELDCRMGKRCITQQIIGRRFPDLKFIIVGNSTSSVNETAA